MPLRTVYLVRHGQENKTDRPDHLGGALTELGEQQAKATAMFLQAIPLTSIYASTLRRAEQTAVPIIARHPGVPVTKTNLLWETMPAMPASVHEGMGNAAQQMVLQEEARIARAFSRYFRDPRAEADEHVLLVCHGNLIRYFICRVLGISPLHWVRMEMSNCGLSRVEVQRDGHKILLSHNETAHLLPNWHTEM